MVIKNWQKTFSKMLVNVESNWLFGTKLKAGKQLIIVKRQDGEKFKTIRKKGSLPDV